jgi:hypothetical protein
MAARCGICRRSDREEIDSDLLRGTPLRDIEAGHGGTTKSSLDRHKPHAVRRLSKAAGAHEAAEGGKLLRKLQRLEERAEGLLRKAERKGQLVAGASLIRELRELLRLFGEISGDLKHGAAVTVNLFQLPEWGAVQRRLLAALAAFPEARIAAARALLPPAANGGGPDA